MNSGSLLPLALPLPLPFSGVGSAGGGAWVVGLAGVDLGGGGGVLVVAGFSDTECEDE